MTKLRTKVCSLSLAISAVSSMAYAQEQAGAVEEVMVTGIRASLQNAIEEKRAATNLIEVIQSEDIGKLPDQNLAEVLENVTGVQITRSAGVGTGVQIRGTDANRTEINGVSTVGSGAGRSGINFEDVPASIISAVEVTKAPQAKTIEGSVGGTVNLRTIRPLDLKETLIAARIQGEDSSLSADGSLTPRVSGSFGTNWETGMGEMGVVISASYAEQDVTAFRPRADRDNLVVGDNDANTPRPDFSFLPIQFLNQDYDNYKYETSNVTASFEWAPDDNLKLYTDVIVNQQERREESSRIQASGVGTAEITTTSIPTQFETVNFGTLQGADGSQELGSIQAALVGVINTNASGRGPVLRMSSDTNSRITDSDIFRIGGEYSFERFSVRVESALSTSESSTPSLNTTLNFINPNSTQPTAALNENGTPFAYDLSDGLTFGIAQGLASSPTKEQLLDPANYRLRDVNVTLSTVENSEEAHRIDFIYDLDQAGITTIDFGYRFSKAESTNDDIQSNKSFRAMNHSAPGNLFAELLSPGPTNFNAADGRELYVRDFLYIDPKLVAADLNGAFDTLSAATNTHQAPLTTKNPLSAPSSQNNSYFNITEETQAFYGQANFEYGILRGNAGVRYVAIDTTSVGRSTVTGGAIVGAVNTNDYDFWLPRLNLAADVAEDVVVRVGYGFDIRRPDFDDLSSSASYSTSPNPPVAIGNPSLLPEEVESYDISAEWYFAPAAMVSVGYFHKIRSDVFRNKQVDPYSEPGTNYRDITAPCEQGGVFNPIADRNVFSATPGTGICVPSQTTINDTAETTQKGIELAVQYDLSEFEHVLGWASGFGVLANYTWQEFSGGDTVDVASSRANQIFAVSSGGAITNATFKQSLINLSENAYNITAYYEKYGLSARLRYTWREAYRSEDFGSTSSYPWGFPVVQEDRGQLNASITYDITEQFNIGIEGVNLTESSVEQSCVNNGSVLCFQGLTDRRITVGASYKF